MNVFIYKLTVASTLVFCASVSAMADQTSVPFEPFLDCAASKSACAFFLKNSGNDTGDELKKSERGVRFYLQIAESLSERQLRDEFLESGERERKKAEEIFRVGGRDAIFAHNKKRETECAVLVQKHQKEIMKAVDKIYADQK